MNVCKPVMEQKQLAHIPQLEWTERFFIGQLSNWLARRTVNAIPLGV